MTDYAWFRLLLRAVGLLLIGLALPNVINMAGYLLTMVATQSAPNPPMGPFLSLYLGSLLGYLAQAALGAYLLFGGHWIIARALAELRGRCAGCGYDLTALSSTTCPECGLPCSSHAARQDSAPRTP